MVEEGKGGVGEDREEEGGIRGVRALDQDELNRHQRERNRELKKQREEKEED